MLIVPDDDVDLWNAICRDDEAAFTALFNRYWELLYNTSFRCLKDHEVSEEIVHDIFLSIWNRRKDLKITSFKNFLLKSVRYQIYNRARANKSPITFADQSVYENYVFEENNGETRIRESELDQELDKYLNQLPYRCKEIFKMSRIKNLSNQEIALQLGISKRSVENQITLALKYLRVYFKYIVSTILLFMLT
ncbi:MAG: RNA polymerase sigma factor [Mucilaginibacter sp.]|uniref:RNA polymerase sigma factor n=1 Tax=Mucilaginibacter sp. TaxID=1882438 RepID=UPI0034E507F2